MRRFTSHGSAPLPRALQVVGRNLRPARPPSPARGARNKVPAVDGVTCRHTLTKWSTNHRLSQVEQRRKGGAASVALRRGRLGRRWEGRGGGGGGYPRHGTHSQAACSDLHYYAH